MQIKNTVIGSENSITEKDLQDLENEYGFKFPEDLKQFYLQYNGGRLEKYCYTPKENTIIDLFTFHQFFSIKYGSATLNIKMKLNYVDDWWPKEYIPFGLDGGGNSYCFHKQNGKIYYLYEDDLDDDDNVPIDYLAPDFLTFINNMDYED